MASVLEQIESLLAEASPPWQLVDVHANLQKRVDIQLHCLLRNHAADLLSVSRWAQMVRGYVGSSYDRQGESVEESLERLEAELVE